MQRVTSEYRPMKLQVFYLALVLWLISACTCIECETFSPEEIEKFSTGMAITMPDPMAQDKPTVICYGDVDADDWLDIRAFMAEVQAAFGDTVIVTQASSERLAGYQPYEDLQLESVPACLIFTSEPDEVFRTYDDFTLEAFEAQLRALVDE